MNKFNYNYVLSIHTCIYTHIHTYIHITFTIFFLHISDLATSLRNKNIIEPTLMCVVRNVSITICQLLSHCLNNTVNFSDICIYIYMCKRMSMSYRYFFSFRCGWTDIEVQKYCSDKCTVVV